MNCQILTAFKLSINHHFVNDGLEKVPKGVKEKLLIRLHFENASNVHYNHGFDVLISSGTAVEKAGFKEIVHFLFVLLVDVLDGNEFVLPVFEVFVILKCLLKVVLVGINHFEEESSFFQIKHNLGGLILLKDLNKLDNFIIFDMRIDWISPVTKNKSFDDIFLFKADVFGLGEEEEGLLGDEGKVSLHN